MPDLSSVASPPRRDLEYDDLEMGEVIGSGGQAVVSEAHVATENGTQRLAVKQPARDANTLSRETIDRFLEEAQTWATVDAREREKPRWRDSEHIVGVTDIGEQSPWIALEYMDGGSLADRLDENPDGLSLDETLWIGECICRGVEVAHNYGIAHLDLKPSNVLFRKTSEDAWDVAKVGDWGTASILAEQTTSVDISLSIKFAAPEQFEPVKFGEPDMLTDIYQIGSILYAGLTGRPPFKGSQASIMQKVLGEEVPEPPSVHRPQVPAELDRFVLRALERDKTDRFRAVGMMTEILEAFRTEGPNAIEVTVPSNGREQIGGASRSESETFITPEIEAEIRSTIEKAWGETAETLHIGTVDHFDETDTYGFIECSSFTQDVRFRSDDIVGPEVEQGATVWFSAELTSEGPKATKLTRGPPGQFL